MFIPLLSFDKNYKQESNLLRCGGLLKKEKIYIYIYINYIHIYSSNKNIINANCLSFDDPFLASKKDSQVSYQEYKQQYKNELTA